MRALIIDENAKNQIRKLIEYAEHKPVSLQDMQDTLSGKKKPIGDNLMHVLHLFQGYRVVYSEENQPMGLCRHLSISVEGDKYPHPVACEEILKEFGFRLKGKIEQTADIMPWMEPEKRAINFIQLKWPRNES